jgi:hypothetical protein
MLQCQWEPTPFVNAKDGRRFVVCKHKGCPKYAFARLDGRQPKSNCRHGHFALGDAVAGAIRFVTAGLIKPCRACKSRIRTLNRLLTTKIPGDVWAWLRGGWRKDVWTTPDDPTWKKLEPMLAYQPLNQFVAVDRLDAIPADDPRYDDKDSLAVVKLVNPPHFQPVTHP